jgi:aspartyl-tRNA(Asn)/glutamyl-tRNA(Gln) amidotransferase subunit A
MPAHPREKLGAEFLLEQRDLAAQRRLGDSQLGGRFCEAATLGNPGEVEKLLTIHGLVSLVHISTAPASVERRMQNRYPMRPPRRREFMSDELCDLSARELHEAYHSRAVSPVEVATAVLARIDHLNPRFNAFASINPDVTMEMARSSESRWLRDAPLGPGDGIPTTIKDVMQIRSWPTLCGSKTVSPDQPWTSDTACVARLREAGAVFVGKTTTPEFGWKGLGDSPRHGETRNPWDPRLTPGGSSAGAGVAAAFGLGVWHAASDAAGSIRIPAAFCGVVGFKPTYGVVPLFPASVFSGLGHHGPIARTVRDAAGMLAIMSGADPRDGVAAPSCARSLDMPACTDLAGLRIGYVADADFPTDPDIRRLTDLAARNLQELGAHVDDIDLDLTEARSQIEIQWQVGCALLLQSIPAADHHLVDAGLVRMAEAGERVSATQFRAAQLAREQLATKLNLLHERVDLLVTPTVPILPFALGSETPAQSRFAAWLDWTPFTYPFNLTQQPAASVPCGLTPTSLPAALQIVGKRFADALVLRAAHALEQSLRCCLTDRLQQLRATSEP